MIDNDDFQLESWKSGEGVLADNAALMCDSEENFQTKLDVRNAILEESRVRINKNKIVGGYKIKNGKAIEILSNMLKTNWEYYTV